MRLFRKLIIFVIVYGAAYVPALAQEESFGEGTNNVRKKWLDEGPIPYKLASSLTRLDKAEIRAAIAFWEANTCLSFKETVGGPHILEFYANDTCYGYVGGIRNKQVTSAEKQCHTVNLVAHALGVDRKPKPSRGRHFVNRKNAKVRRKTRPYNSGSRHHKSTSLKKKAANEDQEPTAITYDNEYLHALGDQRATFYDIFAINEGYGCLDRCKNSKTVCHNGGYRDVKNCDVCKCPTGYGGKFCNERPSGCGGTLQATDNYQTFRNRKDKPATFDPLTFAYKYCNYWIQAPKGKSLEVKAHLLASKCSTGCKNMGAEFKIGADQRLSGYRFCCPNTTTIITTARNILPVISYTVSAQDIQFEITYRYSNVSHPKPSINALGKNRAKRSVALATAAVVSIASSIVGTVGSIFGVPSNEREIRKQQKHLNRLNNTLSQLHQENRLHQQNRRNQLNQLNGQMNQLNQQNRLNQQNLQKQLNQLNRPLNKMSHEMDEIDWLLKQLNR